MGFRMKTFIICSLLFLSSCCPGWKINEVESLKFKEATKQDYIEFGEGVLFAFATHYIGHVIYLESKGLEWEQRGLTEYIKEPISNGEREAFVRSAFITQIIPSIFLNIYKRDSYFTKGVDFGNFSEIVFNKGDRDWLGENKNLEWGVYTITATGLLIY